MILSNGNVMLRFLFLFNVCSASFLFFVVFTLINKYDTFQWLLRYVHTHACTHTHTRARIRNHTHPHYDILSDILIILDHGNICVDTIFMIIIIIVHIFTDIEEMMFSIMAVLICIHINIYICIFIRQHF